VLTAKTPTGRFRICWRGYDTEQVDEFLRQTAADRQRVAEGLAQLEVLMAVPADERRRELDRLTKLRIEVASCLETSISALHTATALLPKEVPLASHAPSPQPVSPLAPPALPEPAIVEPRWTKPAWMAAGRTQMSVAAALVAAAIPTALLLRSGAQEIPAEASAAPPQAVTASQSPSRVDPVAATTGQEIEGLFLTITANRECWIRTHVDGGQPLERLLQANETIVLRANEEAILRVGDASALSLLINNRVARPLGARGQVVNMRITRANYLTLLADDAAPAT
jgi:DivIVA domain-containing protein